MTSLPFQVLWRRALVIVHDLCWIPLAIAIAFWLRFNLESIPADALPAMWTMMVIAIPVHAATFWFFGCYRGVWRFASMPDLMRLSRAVLVGALLTLALHFAWDRLAAVPRTAAMLYPFLLLGATGGARIVVRLYKDLRTGVATRPGVRRALIIGAGESGELLYRGLQREQSVTPVGFLDDDPGKWGTEVHGLRVQGGIARLGHFVRKCRADVVIVAIPSITRETLSRVVTLASEAGVECEVMPTVANYHNAQDVIGELRPVTTEDLLGRDPVSLDEKAIASVVAGRTVLVTGGGGSIGLELCRRVLAHGADRVLVFDRNELNLYQAERALLAESSTGRFECLLGDVCEAGRIARVLAQYRPSVVFHAAAFKHVPLLESNALEALRNNTLGSAIVAEAAGEAGVEKFVQVSTDKTVNPTNVMGASKRVAEKLCLGIRGRYPGTEYVIVRFGNVLASAGSVIPLFEQQIREGGPVTVTHPEVKRYFMTIEEAVGLILQATGQSRGGEVYVLDMGEPVLIRELAENMIRLSGRIPGQDIEITYTGLRPGEKLREELFYEAEQLYGTRHPKLLLARDPEADQLDADRMLARCREAVQAATEERALQCLQEWVPEFSRVGHTDASSKPVRLVR